MPRVLSKLQIDEVAFCAEGMNPEARMTLYKSKRAIQKAEGDAVVPTFGAMLNDSRAMEIDGAIDTRLFALLDTTTRIMRTDGIDREAAILAAVEDYAATMTRDVPELFAGRLAKHLADWHQNGGTIANVIKAVNDELEAVDLVDDLKKGEAMNWLTKLSKEARSALDNLLGGGDLAELCKGIPDGVGALLGGLAERAVEASNVEDALAKAKVDLAKAQVDSGNESEIDVVLKSVTDPAARSVIEKLRSDAAKRGGEVIALQKAARRNELVLIVKDLAHLPNENGSLVELLSKADQAGFVDDLKKVLASANEQAKLAKSYEELGLDTIPGEGSSSTPEEADRALYAKAAEIRKSQPTLSEAQAYAKACEQNPQLYEAAASNPS